MKRFVSSMVGFLTFGQFLCIAAMALLITLSVGVIANSPDTIYKPLAGFAGRVLPTKEVKAGTFSIRHSEFEAALAEWGSDAVLVYGNEGLKIWRPDPKTNGVFQVSEKAYFNFFLYQHHTEWNEGTRLLTIQPQINSTFLVLIVLGFIISILFFLLLK